MEKYSYIINDVIHTEKSRELVSKMIPVLIKWAKEGKSGMTYGNLTDAINYGSSQIGRQLGMVHDVLTRLYEESHIEIPTLNAIVMSQGQTVPSDGFDYVFPGYSTLSYEQKKEIAFLKNQEAHNYTKWDWVLGALGLKVAISEEDEKSIRSGSFGFGGEGEEHKKLKEFIASHPTVVGVDTTKQGETEHILLSGDRLDVYFADKNVAIEVKSYISDNADILRGLFQCVKYKSILDAEAAVHSEIPTAKVILAIGGSLSSSNKEVMETLGINVIQVNMESAAANIKS